MSAAAQILPGASDDRFAQATQLQLTWWRFRRHKLAVISMAIILLFYAIAVFADFLAVADPHATDAAAATSRPRPSTSWPRTRRPSPSPP